MIAFLNRNDLDNLRLAIDKMKGVDFDAARKMEILLEAYEAQNGDDSELGQLKDEIEDLPGYVEGLSHRDNLASTSDLLGRALENVQEWRDSKDDEPLDEAVTRLVEAAEKEDPRVGPLEAALADIVATVDRGEPDALIEVRNLAVGAL